jgi:hypothetical protein
MDVFKQIFNRIRIIPIHLLLIAILTVVILLHQSTQTLPDPAIFQKWMHSYEEDTPGYKIYHPSSFDFPLGWSRKGMEFKQDGNFILHDIAPDDSRVEIQGNWELVSNKDLKISFPSGKKESFIIIIEELRPNILKIRNHEKTLD